MRTAIARAVRARSEEDYQSSRYARSVRPAPRLFVVLAQRAPRAVILRRGPSNWFHLILWNTAKDTFEHGAWFRGTIYEERCDLSPDGELFVYFALQGSRYRTTYKGAWTAVSRPPWLHALALWPQDHTYGGGGRFTGDRALVLRTPDTPAHPDHPVVGLEVTSGRAEHKLQHETVEGVDWSGKDHDGRVVFTADGKLFRRLAKGDVELADFNALEPDPQPAPDAARVQIAVKRVKKKRKTAR